MKSLGLKTVQKHWDHYGARDPFWAILSHPEKRNGAWDVREFFETGISEVEAAVRYVESVYPLAHKRRALDFGCGVGRLTQPLGAHFEQVYGVDISPSMIGQAREFNRLGDRCQYLHNDRSDLSMFPDRSFDFIYSNLTLQHVPPRYSRKYIAEMVRVLAPGGALLFRLPGRAHGLRIPGYLRRLGRVIWNLVHPRQPMVGMYGIPKEQVIALVTSYGGQVLDAAPDGSAGPHWESTQYLVTT